MNDTAEQSMLRQATALFLDREMPTSRLRTLAAAGGGFDPAWWARAAALGWTGLFHREFGDPHTAVTSAAIVAEQVGRHCAPGPLIPSVVVSAMLADPASPQLGRIADAQAQGDAVVAWCVKEESGTWDPGTLRASVERRGSGYVLCGRKTLVESADRSGYFLVLARQGDDVVAVVVPSDAPGVGIEERASLDFVRRYATIEFDSVDVDGGCHLGPLSRETLDWSLALANVLACAEMCGAVARVFEFTLDYAMNRYSFGQPLAAYQALKHKFADMKLWVEACRATTQSAALAVQERSADYPRLAAVAKSYVGDHAGEIVQGCIQMHGAIGVTWEHDLHLYLRRVTVLRRLYGSPDHHRLRLGHNVRSAVMTGV